MIQMLIESRQLLTTQKEPLIKINHAFNAPSFQLAPPNKIDLTAAHQPAASMTKFGSAGQARQLTVSAFISRGRMFYFEPLVSEPVEPQQQQPPGFVWGPSLAHLLLSMKAFCLWVCELLWKCQQKKTKGRNPGKWLQRRCTSLGIAAHSIIGMCCGLCNGRCLFSLQTVSTLSLGKGRWCSKATAADWKVWHLIENRSCGPAQRRVSTLRVFIW